MMRIFIHKIRDAYFYLFFCGYWTAYNLGERANPEINAEYILTFYWLIFLISIKNILYKVINLNISLILVLIFCFLLPKSLNYFIFLKDKKFKKELSKYNYLNFPEYKKRSKLVVIIAVVLVAGFFFITLLIE
jgi:hypothetical protein